MLTFIQNNKVLSVALFLYGLGIHNVSPYMFVFIFAYYLLSGIKPKLNAPQILTLLALVSSVVTKDLFYINFFIKISIVSLVATMVTQKDRNSLIYCFEIIAFSYVLQLMLVYLYNISTGTILSRSLIHYSSKEEASATGLACMLIPYCSLLPLFLYNKKLKSIEAALFLICYSFALYINLILAGRTFFVLTVISIVCGFIISYIFNTGIGKRQVLKRFFGFITIASLLVVAFHVQLSNVILGSNFYERFFSNNSSLIL